MLWTIYPGESKWMGSDVDPHCPQFLTSNACSRQTYQCGVITWLAPLLLQKKKRRREGDTDWISSPQLATSLPCSVPFTSPRLLCCINVLPGLSLPATCFTTALRLLSLSLALCFYLWLSPARNPLIHSPF